MKKGGERSLCNVQLIYLIQQVNTSGAHTTHETMLFFFWCDAQWKRTDHRNMSSRYMDLWVIKWVPQGIRRSLAYATDNYTGESDWELLQYRYSLSLALSNPQCFPIFRSKPYVIYDKVSVLWPNTGPLHELASKLYEHYKPKHWNQDAKRVGRCQQVVSLQLFFSESNTVCYVV